MTSRKNLTISSALLTEARERGADLAGFASVADLKSSPSFTFAPNMPGIAQGIGTRENKLGLKPGAVLWPQRARTVMVVAVHHPEDKPELDWWYGRVDPPGNRVLATIVRGLCESIQERLEVGVFHLPYHIEKGGTYLKDSAVMAGLGTLGKNNMVVTPEYGPRVRLRALTLDIKLPSTGPIAFDPCSGCAGWCRNACPRHAFEKRIYSGRAYGQRILPGRDGSFCRPRCNRQMDADIEAAKEQHAEGFDEPVKLIKFCRQCELSCPVGKPLPVP